MDSGMLSSIPGSCPLFRDVVQHSGQDPKIGQLQNGINDIFDRIRPTTSNGMPRQLQTEWPDNIERNTQAYGRNFTHLLSIPIFLPPSELQVS